MVKINGNGNGNGAYKKSTSIKELAKSMKEHFNTPYKMTLLDLSNMNCSFKVSNQIIKPCIMAQTKKDLSLQILPSAAAVNLPMPLRYLIGMIASKKVLKFTCSPGKTVKKYIEGKIINLSGLLDAIDRQSIADTYENKVIDNILNFIEEVPGLAKTSPPAKPEEKAPTKEEKSLFSPEAYEEINKILTQIGQKSLEKIAQLIRDINDKNGQLLSEVIENLQETKDKAIKKGSLEFLRKAFGKIIQDNATLHQNPIYQYLYGRILYLLKETDPATYNVHTLPNKEIMEIFDLALKNLESISDIEISGLMAAEIHFWCGLVSANITGDFQKARNEYEIAIKALLFYPENIPLRDKIKAAQADLPKKYRPTLL